MPKDYLKSVAAAYGAGDPKLHEIGLKALKEMDELQTELQNQARMIRQLLARVPKPPEPRPATVVAVVAEEANGAKLSDEMKERIRELYLGEYHRTRRWLTAQELVDRMRAGGVNFGVAQPVPSVGTVLAATRRQYEAAGAEHSSGSSGETR
jgi:hypothetical protein